MAQTISQKKKASRERRHKKIRTRVRGTAEKPRLSVFKSNRRIVAQLIDDERGATIVATHVAGAKGKNKTQAAKDAGMELAKQALAKGIKVAAFDRGGFRYTGRIAAFADGAREGGLKV